LTEPDFWGRITGRAELLLISALALSWLAAGAWLGRRKLTRWPALFGAGVALALLVLVWLAPGQAARAAVLQQACGGAGGELPAGTEVLVHDAGGAWRIAGLQGTLCPKSALELVVP
jgi:hypothetical protein